MKLNKEQFLKSEFGSELEGVIKAWDIALQQSRNASETLRDLAWCQAQWEVYKLALKHFYGVEYFSPERMSILVFAPRMRAIG